MPLSKIEQSSVNSGVAGTGPAFSAYLSTAQTLTNAGYTKIAFDLEEFDTNNNFASGRFTPTVAGYYSLSVSIGFNSVVASEVVVVLYKNGSPFKFAADMTNSIYAVNSSWASVAANGTGDYYEIYVYQNSSRAATSGITNTVFCGSMIRSA